MASTVSSDVKFLMDREGVPGDLVTKFMDAGITTVRLFAAFAADAQDVRKTLTDDFGIDGATLVGRVTAGKVIVAWELAKARSSKLAEAEAESEVRQEAKPLRQTDFRAMREAYEARWWKLERKQVPSRTYVEKIGDGVEKGDPRAEPLSEVTNSEEGETDLMKAVFDPTGNIKAIKASSTVPLPRDPEELRQRIMLLGRAWSFVAFQQPNCAWLKDLTPQAFQEYLDYLLGPFVYKLVARDEHGNQSAAPPWNLLLSYELEVRRKAMALVAEGVPLVKALKDAFQDPVTKERYFNTPLALVATLRGQKRTYDEANNPTHPGGGNPGGGKGKGKGRKNPRRRTGGKGKGKGNGCKPKTPDGKLVCFDYNSGDGCSRSGCKFLHICGTCFGKHPMQECPN